MAKVKVFHNANDNNNAAGADNNAADNATGVITITLILVPNSRVKNPYGICLAAIL